MRTRVGQERSEGHSRAEELKTRFGRGRPEGRRWVKEMKRLLGENRGGVGLKGLEDLLLQLSRCLAKGVKGIFSAAKQCKGSVRQL